MKKISIVLVVLLSCFTFEASAQFGLANRIKLISGNLAFLKGEANLNVEFNYDDMKVGEMAEVDYMVKHMSDLDRAKAGSGDEWKKKWNEDRSLKFEPAFMKTFAKRLSKLGTVASKGNASAKYTVIIKTIKTEPGVYTGISYAQKDAFIDVRVIFIETSNPAAPLAEVTGTYIKGKETFDTSARITYSYTSWGNILGAFIVTQIKKLK